MQESYTLTEKGVRNKKAQDRGMVLRIAEMSGTLKKEKDTK